MNVQQVFLLFALLLKHMVDLALFPLKPESVASRSIGHFLQREIQH